MTCIRATSHKWKSLDINAQFGNSSNQPHFEGAEANKYTCSHLIFSPVRHLIGV